MFWGICAQYTTQEEAPVYKQVNTPCSLLVITFFKISIPKMMHIGRIMIGNVSKLGNSVIDKTEVIGLFVRYAEYMHTPG